MPIRFASIISTTCAVEACVCWNSSMFTEGMRMQEAADFPLLRGLPAISGSALNALDSLSCVAGPRKAWSFNRAGHRREAPRQPGSSLRNCRWICSPVVLFQAIPPEMHDHAGEFETMKHAAVRFRWAYPPHALIALPRGLQNRADSVIVGGERRRYSPGCRSCAPGRARQLFRRLPGTSVWASAVVLHQYLVAAIVILMLSGGKALEEYATRRASSVLGALARRMPQVAHRISSSGATSEMPADTVTIGDRLMIYPHELCPVDGVVVEGRGTPLRSRERFSRN